METSASDPLSPCNHNRMYVRSGGDSLSMSARNRFSAAYRSGGVGLVLCPARRQANAPPAGCGRARLPARSNIAGSPADSVILPVRRNSLRFPCRHSRSLSRDRRPFVGEASVASSRLEMGRHGAASPETLLPASSTSAKILGRSAGFSRLYSATSASVRTFASRWPSSGRRSSARHWRSARNWANRCIGRNASGGSQVCRNPYTKSLGPRTTISPAKRSKSGVAGPKAGCGIPVPNVRVAANRNSRIELMTLRTDYRPLVTRTFPYKQKARPKPRLLPIASAYRRRRSTSTASTRTASAAANWPCEVIRPKFALLKSVLRRAPDDAIEDIERFHPHVQAQLIRHRDRLGKADVLGHIPWSPHVAVDARRVPQLAHRC